MLTDRDGKTEWKGSGTQYLVKYVFPGSPAHGKVAPGDVITGPAQLGAGLPSGALTRPASTASRSRPSTPSATGSASGTRGR